MRISFAALALVAAVAFFTAASPVEAKEGSYLVGARLFGGRLLDRSVELTITLPENYDDMAEAEPPPGVWGSVAQGAGYHIQLLYDFSAEGYGTRTRLGRYDGNDRLFFSEPMQVGPGTWGAGWFTASPLLVAALQQALAPTPPGAGNSGARRAEGGSVPIGVGLLSFAVVVAVAPAVRAALASWRGVA